MQKLFFFCLLAIGFNYASAQNAASPADSTTFEFKEMEVQFGTIKQGDKFETDFVFTNTGKAPLKIASAQGSCGCTVPEYPKDPIAPGATGKIHVTFNSAGKMGDQYKTITIQANTRPNPIRLAVKGKVEPPTTELGANTPQKTPEVQKAIPMPATPSIKFPTTEHNFGSVAPNTDVVVKFTNAGAQPLQLKKVKAGDKNTKIVSYTKTPLATGESGMVTYRVKSKAPKGAYKSSLKINTNGTPTDIVMPVMGNVL